MGTRWMIVIVALCAAALTACGGGGAAGPESPAPPVTLLDVSPLQGSTAGGTVVTLRGSGFLGPEFESLTVYFGEEQALDVRIVNDTTVVCTVPPGRIGPVAVNVFGLDEMEPLLAGGFVYVASAAYVADGPQALLPSLHLLDLDAGTVRLVGPIGYPIGALAIMPDGRLYGAEPVSPFRLILIDPGSGQGTALVLLRDAGTGAPVEISDMAVLDGLLMARTAAGALVEIDSASGFVDVLDQHTALEAGAALGALADGTLLVGPGLGSLQFGSWDAAAGLAPYGVDVNGLSSGVLRSLSIRDGWIHGIEVPGSAGAHVNVLRIDPVTGGVVLVTSLPSSVVAIAGDF